MEFEAGLRATLQTLEETNRARKLRPFSKREGPFVWDELGNRYVNFTSNNYLGVFAQYGRQPLEGAGGSRLLGGDTQTAHELEHAISSALGHPAALFFNSGYHMNVGVISCLYGHKDVVFCDKLVHASIIDGIRLSGAKMYRFRHNDMNHLEALLSAHRKQFSRALIVTESVFSMDGDFSPIIDLIRLKSANDAQLMIDDAHGVGMFGDQGYGCLENVNEIDLATGTFGKALGSYGGYVACSQTIRDYLVNHCRFFIYSTALPEALLKWNLSTWRALPNLKNERDDVQRLAQKMREGLPGRKCFGETHIVPVLAGSVDVAKRLEERFLNRGIWVSAIRPPTVPENKCRLRFSITALHSDDHISEVCEVLNADLS